MSLAYRPAGGNEGYVGWPRTLRGDSAGHSSRTARKTTGRPSRASRRPPGTKNKARNPWNGEQPTAPPGHLPPLAWPGGSSPFVPCRGRARPAPWTPKARVHSPSSLPPEPPIPPNWLCRPSGEPQLKFRGKGGLRAP